MGLLHYFLGIEVNQIVGIFISQRKYVVDPLKRFNMLDCNTTSTHMNANESLIAKDGIGLTSSETYFRSIAGGLNYLTHTRPDITISISLISRFMHNPTMHHLGTTKRIMRYVAGTVDYGI